MGNLFMATKIIAGQLRAIMKLGPICIGPYDGYDRDENSAVRKIWMMMTKAIGTKAQEKVQKQIPFGTNQGMSKK